MRHSLATYSILFVALTCGTLIACSKKISNISSALGGGHFFTPTSHNDAAADTAFQGVLTYHNDLYRTGVNDKETVLNLQNVSPGTFGKLATLKTAYGDHTNPQPLYVPNLTMSDGQVYNVLFVGTSTDQMYAFDADSTNSTILWHKSYVDSKETVGILSGKVPVRADQVGFQKPNPTLTGITGTPTIDLSTQTMYFVSKVYDIDTNEFILRLHAVDITNGSDRTNSPMIISASYPGTGFQYDDNNSDARYPNGHHYHDETFQKDGKTYFRFNSKQQMQRPGLALFDGKIYIAFGSHGDYQPYHGWMMAYDASTLQQLGAIPVTPNTSGGGFWMAAGGTAVDSDGFIYAVTGNGAFDNKIELGDSLIKFNLDLGGLHIADFFTPYNQSQLDGLDADFGSGGVLLIPEDQTPGKKMMVAGGKEGTLYLVDRENLGKFNKCNGESLRQAHGTCNDDQIVQHLDNVLPGAGGHFNSSDGIYNTPAFFNGRMFIHPGGEVVTPEESAVAGLPAGTKLGVLNVFELNATGGTYKFNPNPVAKGDANFTQIGATPAISANGTSDAILWEIQQEGRSVLHAYDITNIANSQVTEIYNSNLAGTRDAPSSSFHFLTPTVADGKVFVQGGGGIDVYGLIRDQQPYSMSLDTDYYQPGDRPTWTLIGCTPHRKILWSSTKTVNGVTQDEEINANYDTFTDQNGNFKVTTQPWTADLAGEWTRSAICDGQTATVKYTISAQRLEFKVVNTKTGDDSALLNVSHQEVHFKLDKDVPMWSITGAPPHSHIYWSAHVNSGMAETNVDYASYGVITDENGSWIGNGGPFPQDGHWLRSITVGKISAVIPLEVDP